MSQRGVVESAIAWRAEGAPFALVLVTETEGSTYRKAGGLAAVARDGRRAGVLSGGCLEPDVDALAHAAVDAGSARRRDLDTRRDDDLLFGSGSGCRGRMSLLAVPWLPGHACPLLDAVAAAWTSGRDAVLDVAALAPGVAPSRSVVVRRPPALLLLGAGPEAPPLLAFARALGWRAIVGDHRPALLEPPRLEQADRVIGGRPREIVAAAGSEPLDAVILMTHGADADLEALRALAPHAVPRIGLLGPPARRDELLARLDPREREALSPRLRAPAGLRLGGDGPEAIALAVVAEIQAHLSGISP